MWQMMTYLTAKWGAKSSDFTIKMDESTFSSIFYF